MNNFILKILFIGQLLRVFLWQFKLQYQIHQRFLMDEVLYLIISRLALRELQQRQQLQLFRLQPNYLDFLKVQRAT